MPFPSKGCQSCKIRRIKCDETYPICLKCLKSKRSCEGMGDGQSLAVVHIENIYASGQRKRPRGPRPNGDASQTGHPEPPLSWTPVDLNSLAVAYYVRYHLQSPKENPELLKSLLHCIIPRWSQNAQYRMIDLAVSSKALATFSRTQKHPPAAVEASSKYRQLLCMAYETISHLDKDSIDACLLAIFFMSRYEGVIYQSSQSEMPFFSTLQSFTHHDGASAVLKIWKYRFSHIQPPSDVVKLTRRGLIRSTLLRTREIPHWMIEGASFGESGLDLEFDRIIVQITNIRSRLSALSVDRDAARKSLAAAEDLCKETQETDETLQTWAGHFPDLWPFTRHKVSTTGIWSPQRYFYSATVYSYSTPAFAGAWGNYYATRMLVLSTWITILEACHLNTEEVAQECQQNLEVMANDLASSLPFCLQQFIGGAGESESTKPQDPIRLSKGKEIEPYLATLMVWPLTLASSLKHVEIKQRSWFKSVLARLGRVTGVGMLEHANTERWPQL